jgi:O-antigen ligase
MMAASTQPAWWWWLVAVLASSPLWVGVLQLVPIPATWWFALPGRAEYAPAMQAAGVAVPLSLPLSLNPQASWAGLWAGVPVTAAFLVALRLPRAQIDKLMTALLLVGLLQVVLAMAQFGSGRQSPLYFGELGQGFIGSFANRNHLADFLAMLVPVWFYGWLRLQRSPDGASGRSWQGRLASRPPWLLLGFSFLVVILSTQSRGGILAATMVLLLSVLLYVWSFRHQLSRRQIVVLGVLFGVFVVLAVALIDVRGLVARVTGGRFETDADLRQTLALATWDAARTFWPWGSGMGTFESVFPRFQPAQTAGYINQAHNDYPQLLMELGAPAVLLVALVLVLVVRQVLVLARALRASKRLSSELGVRCFAGLGALALLLHSWVEFNMHIPALAITAGFLAGVFLRPLDPELQRQTSEEPEAEEPVRRRRRRSRSA